MVIGKRPTILNLLQVKLNTISTDKNSSKLLKSKNRHSLNRLHSTNKQHNKQSIENATESEAEQALKDAVLKLGCSSSFSQAVKLVEAEQSFQKAKTAVQKKALST